VAAQVLSDVFVSGTIEFNEIFLLPSQRAPVRLRVPSCLTAGRSIHTTVNLFDEMILIVGGVIVTVVGIGWLGFRVPPPLLFSPVDSSKDLGTIEIPQGLPAPLHRYLCAVAKGDTHLPKIDSMVVCGRAWANFGMWVPIRFRLTHQPGKAFERYMEITWFGIPVLKAIDRFVHGKGMTGPVGNAATGPEIDQGSNMVLYAEAPLMPSLFVDKRLRWEAVDDDTATLFFPFEEGEDKLTVYFDEETSLVTCMKGLRYKGQSTEKVPWRCDFVSWQDVNGCKLPARVSIEWEDDEEPWSFWDISRLVWNVDIAETVSTW